MEFKNLIVDGWNAIHSSRKLCKLLDSSLDLARAALFEEISAVHDYLGSRITVVYDGSGDEISIERPYPEIKTFSEVFTPSFLTADELIEQLCSKAKVPSEIVVVTRDNMLKLTVSSFGALALDPESLWESSKIAYEGIAKTIESNSRYTEKLWRSERIKLENLSLPKDSKGSTPLVSKRMKKRLKKNSILEERKKKALSLGLELISEDVRREAKESGRETKEEKKSSQKIKSFDFITFNGERLGISESGKKRRSR